MADNSIRRNLEMAWDQVLGPSQNKMPPAIIDTKTPQGWAAMDAKIRQGPWQSIGIGTPASTPNPLVSDTGPGDAFLVGMGRAFATPADFLGRGVTSGKLLAAALRGDQERQNQLAQELAAARGQSIDNSAAYNQLLRYRPTAGAGEAVGNSMVPFSLLGGK